MEEVTVASPVTLTEPAYACIATFTALTLTVLPVMVILPGAKPLLSAKPASMADIRDDDVEAVISPVIATLPILAYIARPFVLVRLNVPFIVILPLRE